MKNFVMFMVPLSFITASFWLCWPHEYKDAGQAICNHPFCKAARTRTSDDEVVPYLMCKEKIPFASIENFGKVEEVD